MKRRIQTKGLLTEIDQQLDEGERSVLGKSNGIEFSLEKLANGKGRLVGKRIWDDLIFAVTFDMEAMHDMLKYNQDPWQQLQNTIINQFRENDKKTS